MKLKDIFNAANELAPFALSEEYIEKGHYDNSGVMLDCGREISGVLFSLDLSLAAVEEAQKRGCNAIFTHHPAIWEGVKHLDEAHSPVLFACVKAGISVLSAHLNLDAAENGIDEWLMRGLGGSEPLAVMDRLSRGGYGRVYEVSPVSLQDFLAHVRKEFQTERLVVYGQNPVKRVASFCGGGFEGQSLAFALENGADTLVSSDGKHHLIAEAVEKGLNVVLLTHYAAESYGFGRFCESMKGKLSVPCIFFSDGSLQ